MSISNWLVKMYWLTLMSSVLWDYVDGWRAFFQHGI